MTSKDRLVTYSKNDNAGCDEKFLIELLCLNHDFHYSSLSTPAPPSTPTQHAAVFYFHGAAAESPVNVVLNVNLKLIEMEIIFMILTKNVHYIAKEQVF